MKVGIIKLTIKVGNHSFDLTPEEARELRSKLNELFGCESNPFDFVYPVPAFPMQPIYVQPNTWWPTWCEITCDGASTNELRNDVVTGAATFGLTQSLTPPEPAT